MNIELKPCPFCGANPEARWSQVNPKARCRTEGCKGSQLPVTRLDDPEDIAAWNTRAATQAEVTDAAIDAATRHIYHNGRPTSKEYRVGIARAILALQKNNFSHELVPMTDDEIDAVQQYWIRHQYDLGSQKGPRGFARAIESHHGIKPKEQA